VFVISGAVAEQVVNAGPVATYGPNDMVLDNWGPGALLGGDRASDLARAQRHRVRQLR
jgi:hypothetical protein